MSLQRRRNQHFLLSPVKKIQDSNGNSAWVVDEDSEFPATGWMIPQRATVAEVPGQQLIDVIRIGLNSDLKDEGMVYNLNGFGVWGQVKWRGDKYDIVAPPSYHHGTRHTRHYSIDIRKRP